MKVPSPSVSQVLQLTVAGIEKYCVLLYTVTGDLPEGKSEETTQNH